MVYSATNDGQVFAWTASGSKVLSQNKAHQQSITGLRMAPGSLNVLYSSCLDGTIKVWQADTLQEMHQYEQRKCAVHCIEISPDGSLLAIGREDGKCEIAEGNTNYTTLLVFDVGSTVLTVAYSPTRYWVVIGCRDGSVKIYDLESKALVLQTQYCASCTAVVIRAKDGMLFVGYEDGCIQAYSVTEA